MEGSDKVGNLAGLLADLSLRADAGDDDASCHLNQLAERYPPDVLQEARALAAARREHVEPIGVYPPVFTPVAAEPVSMTAVVNEVLKEGVERDNPWDVISCAVDIIAAHYRLPLDGVWTVILDLEDELHESQGTPAFGRLLEQPVGFGVLGLRVAHIMLGVGVAEQYPIIRLGYQ